MFTDGSNTRYLGAIPFLMAVWCIVAIELTLHWNSVSHVYNIESTGQIIPLVTGIIGLLDTISKKEIIQGESKQKSMREKTHGRRSEAVKQHSSPSAPSSPY